MRIVRVSLFFALVCLVAMSCGRELRRSEQIEQRLVNDFKQRFAFFGGLQGLCGGAPKIKFSSQNLKAGTSFIELSCSMHQRYLLIMVIAVTVDRKGYTIRSCDSTSINLLEVVSVTGSPVGPLSIKHGKTFRLSPDQWRTLIDAKGDFPRIGITLITNSPAQGFGLLEAYRGLD
jgi:hypothetical protein